MRQMMAETLVLAFVGAAAGMLAGFAATQALASVNLEADLPIRLDFPFDWRVFIYGLAAAAVTGALAAAVPALRACAGNLAQTLYEASRSVVGSRHRFRSALAAAELGGALTLLIVPTTTTNGRSSAQASTNSDGMPQREPRSKAAKTVTAQTHAMKAPDLGHRRAP